MNSVVTFFTENTQIGKKYIVKIAINEVMNMIVNIEM